MNEGQNDNLSTKSLPTHKPARTISSACTSAVHAFERERQTNGDKEIMWKETNKESGRERERERERGMSMYLHGSLVVRIAPVACSC